jgi:pimeloyl-ACP methyl ester carboxylesterase
MPRAAFVSHLAIWRDFDRSYQFAARDLAGWRGRMLILEAEHDGLFPQRERVALRELYPSAEVHTFAHRSHGASLAFMDDYIAVIVRFLSIEAREVQEGPKAPSLPHDMPHKGKYWRSPS